MRGRFGVLLGVLALAGCGEREAAAPASAGSQAEVMPARAPGLWREQVASEGSTQEMRICLDAAATRRLTIMGDELARLDCSVNRTWKLAGGGWGFEHRCDMLEMGRQHWQGTVTGDLETAFVLEARATIEGSGIPKANGPRTTRIEGVREGPCPAGWKPGEVRLANGKRWSVLNTKPVR